MIIAVLYDSCLHFGRYGSCVFFWEWRNAQNLFPNLITSVFSELHMTAQFMMFTSKRFYDQITYTCERMNIWISYIWYSYIHSFFFTFHGFIKTRPNDQLPDGLLAQLVRALHRYRRGHRVRIPPVQAWFFSGFLFTTAKVVSITAMIFFLSKITYSCISLFFSRSSTSLLRS